MLSGAGSSAGKPPAVSTQQVSAEAMQSRVPLIQNFASMASTDQKILKYVSMGVKGETMVISAYIVGDIHKELSVVVANTIHA